MKKFILSVLILFLLVSLLQIPFATASEEGDLAFLLAELDIMNGDPNGELRLTDLVSRAEFTKIAVAASPYRNSVSKSLTVSPFKDVLSTHWVAPYVVVAISGNICSGYPDGSFRPDSTVLYEEAVTMFLKLLGYTDNDFGISWPYGQIGVAEKIGLCDNLSLSLAQPLTRSDALKLTYNLLNTKSKNSTNDYITTLDYSISEDVILIASSNEDPSIGSGKIFTSKGLFKVSGNFNFNDIGKKGDVIIKNHDEIAAFIPTQQIAKEYSIYQVLDSAIVVYINGKIQSLDIDTGIGVYNKSAKTTLSSLMPYISAGDKLVTYSNQNGVLDYGIIKTDEMSGPYTFTSPSQLASLGLLGASVTRDGSPSSINELQINDIIYYSVSLNSIWSYTAKITGVYEKAIPNKDTPTSIEVSGITYSLESAEAFNKLSSKGSIKFGDTITILLGKNNKIADVILPDYSSSSVYGYLIGTGKKEFTANDTNTYVNNYIKIVMTNGKVYEYTSVKDYKSYINSVVKISFSGSQAKLSTLSEQSPTIGFFDWQTKKLGTYKISSNINIIDVYSTNNTDITAYSYVYPQRIDTVNLTTSDILFADVNKDNEITGMILKNVTGDFYTYGIVTKAESISNKVAIYGNYSYMVDGITKSFSTTGKSFNIQQSQPAKILFKNNYIEILQPLLRLNGQISEITESSIRVLGETYHVGDKTSVYIKDSNSDYTMIPLIDLVNNNKDYIIIPYYDKSISNGGRIRIIVATKK